MAAWTLASTIAHICLNLNYALRVGIEEQTILCFSIQLDALDDLITIQTWWRLVYIDIHLSIIYASHPHWTINYSKALSILIVGPVFQACAPTVVRMSLDCLQQERHHATHTQNACFTGKNHRPTEHANRRPILRRRREGTQISVASLLEPKSLVLWRRWPTHSGAARRDQKGRGRRQLGAQWGGKETRRSALRFTGKGAPPCPIVSTRRWPEGERRLGALQGGGSERHMQGFVRWGGKQAAQASGALLSFWVCCWKTTGLGAWSFFCVTQRNKCVLYIGDGCWRQS